MEVDEERRLGPDEGGRADIKQAELAGPALKEVGDGFSSFNPQFSREPCT